ncbi:MAG: menaquinone biosynthesis protein [Leptospiraceae bacterium]|nr:menaquinone biosynthesis protein [Leptospiraceae bacterium]MCK6380497.1 menaquinone biosynthesis protein [Leptospiraceae bacterium]NUM42885.1 menaquinone biosynthesis protein [Leptospiraceae bacterium]
MKIGIIKHLNARPLTYGFERAGNHEIISDNPSGLVGLLISGQLDTALISSIEVFRNSEKLSYCNLVGVSSHNKVRSIVFYKNKNENYPPKYIKTDSGSRTSVALLKLLIRMETGENVEMISTPPDQISKDLHKKIGSHLLFGDNALLDSRDNSYYEKIDLATWWNETTGLPFCFALWAYPKTFPISDSVFTDSLKFGLSNIEEIISNEKRFPNTMTRTYLTEELHFELTEKDKEALLFFRDKCDEFGIL